MMSYYNLSIKLITIKSLYSTCFYHYWRYFCDNL